MILHCLAVDVGEKKMPVKFALRDITSLSYVVIL